MPWYKTFYNPDFSKCKNKEPLVGQYGCDLYAKDDSHADKIIRLRGLNEVIEGSTQYDKYPYKRASKLLRSHVNSDIEKIHGLNFLGMLALSSKVCKPHEILGDKGVLHNYVHHIEFGQDRSNKLKCLIEKVIEIEKKVPGYLHEKDL